jgi:hypothetical protein
MKKKIDVKSLVLGALLGGVIVFSIAAATPEPKHVVWEYQTVTGKIFRGDQNLGDAINASAGQGWEFVSAFHGVEQYAVAVMRREKK